MESRFEDTPLFVEEVGFFTVQDSQFAAHEGACTSALLAYGQTKFLGRLGMEFEKIGVIIELLSGDFLRTIRQTQPASIGYRSKDFHTFAFEGSGFDLPCIAVVLELDVPSTRFAGMGV